MRIVAFESTNDLRIGVIEDGVVHPTASRSFQEFLRDGSFVGAPAPFGTVTLRAPVAKPSKLIFCGINYASHLEENPSAVLPDEPLFFAKLPSAVIGPGDAIRVPYEGCHVDYEVELAVVIGKRAWHVSIDDALEVVFGYTLVNDVSARDVQFRNGQITLGKNFDTFCPLGPVVVSKDELPDIAAIILRTTVNGDVRQSASAGGMLFTIPQLVSRVSHVMTLEPGDIITTGTPAGVGCFRNPPTYLRPGDRVTVEANGIGRLENPVVAGW
jgi:2-keto-4-pentenoate hydratase/2-oxohepta-3-ene-1,7-dioic acid hydratase in catechol pathway